jgi:hypothetical protein
MRCGPITLKSADYVVGHGYASVNKNVLPSVELVDEVLYLIPVVLVVGKKALVSHRHLQTSCVVKKAESSDR